HPRRPCEVVLVDSKDLMLYALGNLTTFLDRLNQIVEEYGDEKVKTNNDAMDVLNYHISMTNNMSISVCNKYYLLENPEIFRDGKDFHIITKVLTEHGWCMMAHPPPGWKPKKELYKREYVVTSKGGVKQISSEHKSLATPTTDVGKDIPAFEAVFSLIGLLMVYFLFLKR
ncbi:MAG: hypothetical protein ACE5J3_11300, partial [Methanosarcinales archaeon]